LQASEPIQDHGDGDHRQVAARQLVIPGRDAPEALEAVDRLLDLGAFPVLVPVLVIRWHLVVALGDDRFDLPFGQPVSQVITAAAIVAGDGIRPHPVHTPLQQRNGLRPKSGVRSPFFGSPPLGGGHGH
jgi:hypothetical protein